MSRSMGVLIKDRFRKNDSMVAYPASATFIELLKCHSCLQEHLNFLKQNNFKLSNNTRHLGETHHLSITVQTTVNRFIAFHRFVKWLLLCKRHQFLVSSTWEQFFVISTTDLRLVLLTSQRAAPGLTSITEEDVADTLINKNIVFLEVTLGFIQKYYK